MEGKAMNKVVEEISKIGIVPVVALEEEKDAKPLAEALCKGGIPCAEVTFRTKAAKDAIHIISTQFPGMLVGAGTVLTTEQVEQAVAAGAKFIVSPGLNPKVVQYCIDKNILIIPGITNPSDIEIAMEFGLEVVKFFPAEAAGGLKMIKAMSEPYSKMKFMPTGGIHIGNLNDYLSFEKIVACGGSWMVKKDLVAMENFEKIETLAREAVRKMLGLELMEIPDLCANGCITIGTNFMERALYHLRLQGVAFDEATKETDDKGKIKAIYLKRESSSQAVQLVQK